MLNNTSFPFYSHRPPKRLALAKNALSNVFSLSKPSSRTFEMDHFSGHILPPFQNKTYVLETPWA
jgi:hypothetical protein